MRDITLGTQRVVVVGNLETPTRALVLVHGRGGAAENILALTQHFALSDDCVVLAPQAEGNTWYPQRFLVPKIENEPYLSATLAMLGELVAYVATAYQIPSERVVLAGFSQGACLVAEFLKTQPARYGGAVVMSGGVIGSDAEAVVVPPSTALAGTPIYLGCDREDFHILKERVELTGAVLGQLGGKVTLRLYEGLGHTIHPEALEQLAAMLQYKGVVN